MKKSKLLLTAAFVSLGITTSLLCACGSETLKAPHAALEGSVVSWEAVEGAEKYVVVVNGEPYETTEIAYTLNETAAGIYDVYVQAVKGEEKKTSEKLVYTVTETLTAPEVSISGNIVSWAAIPHAVGYEVFVNEAGKGGQTATTYSLTETAVGEYSVKVQATGNELYLTSAFSNTVTYAVTQPGSVPETLASPVISIDDGTLSWNAVAGATDYVVFLNGTEAYTTRELSYTLPITLSEGDYSLAVKASNPTSDLYLDSRLSASVSYTVMPLDIEKPLLPMFAASDGTVYLIELQSDGYARLKPYAETNSFKKYMWYLEKQPDSEYYRIKLFNGAYLSWAGQAASDGSECVSVLKESASPDYLQWKVTESGDGLYKIYNLGHSLRWSGDGSGGVAAWNYYFGVKKNDAGTADVIKFGDNCLAVSFINKDIPYVELTRLEKPNLSVDGATVTWRAIEHAVGYEVFVNGTSVGVQTEMEYVMQNQGVVAVVAKSDGENYLDSVKSEPATYEADYGRPILPTTVYEGTRYVTRLDDDGYVRFAPYADVTDFTQHTWYFETDGDTGYYLIKLYDGRYLAWAADKVHGDGTECYATPKDKAKNPEELRWRVAIDETGGYKLYNVAHTARWSAGSWKYYYGITDNALKFADNCPLFALENNDIEFDPENGYVERPAYLDGTWVAYFNVENKPKMMLGTTDGNNVILAVKLYGELTSFNKYLLTVEESETAGWYYIRFGNGKYLCWGETTVTSNNADYAELILADKNTSDDNQLFRLIETGENAYKIECKHYFNLGQTKYLREYWGVFKFVENSGEICYFEAKEYCEIPVVTPDMQKPLVAAFGADNKTILITGEQETKIGEAFASLRDYTNYAWQLETVGDYYKIRLADGRYLYSTAGGNFAYAKAYSQTSADDFLWKFESAGDGKYKIYNKSVGGYPLTADADNGNFHFYSDLGLHEAQLFSLTNVEGVTFGEPQVEHPDDERDNFEAWPYYNDASQMLAEVNAEGIVVIGPKHDTVEDKAKYIWTFEKITEGDDAGYYMIKLADGRYLSYADTTFSAGSAGDTAAAVAAEKDTADVRQRWKLVEDGEGKYKLENKYLSGFYSDVYFGEWWGVYKFNGACLSWTFNVIKK